MEISSFAAHTPRSGQGKSFSPTRLYKQDGKDGRIMKKWVALCIALLLCLQPGALAAGETVILELGTERNKEGLLRLWYDEPAPISGADVRWWQSSVLPVGNGRIGGMVFGALSKDRIHINEKTLWTGGPKNRTGLGSDGQPYRGGNRLTYAGDDVLEEYRSQLDDKTNNVFGLPFGQANSILTQNFFSQRQDKGTYMDFGDIYLDFTRSGLQEDEVTGYTRELDLETAVSTVRYTSAGEDYKREIFVSYPDNVLVCRLTATGKGNLTFDASLTGAMAGTKNISVFGNKITLSGSLSDNGMQYEAQLAVLQEGGTQTEDGSKILVDHADTATLILSAATDYANDYPVYRGEEPAPKVTAAVDGAIEKGYEEMLKAHLEDYEELFSRVDLDLGADTPQIPTDELVRQYREGVCDPALEELIFQYGRYLMIAGSREGTLPTNLCGMWLLGNANELWQGDYHYNINLQMNYWPVYSTNLAECGTALNDFARSLVVPGRYAAAMGFGGAVDEDAPIGEGNGFLVHTAGNPFGATAPAGSQEYGWNPNGGTWLLQNVYDYYRFTQDKEALADTIYPMLKEAANFWAEHLWYSPNQERLTVTPSVSAEQGPTAVGTTYDQSLVWQLFEESIQAADILGVDFADAAVWKEAQDALHPILISDAGYIKEWYEETTPGKAKDGNLEEITIPNYNAGYTYEVHRHSSHLIGLYPGSLINKDNQEYLKAAQKSLLQREFAGTGWSKAHRINLWARAMDGNNAYRLVKGMLQGGNAGILTNLLDSHGNGSGNHTDYPVFQIDGNFGITAGIAEMLLQSHLGYTQFLPALADAWESGSVSGLVARGNFTVDMKWEKKEATALLVRSGSGGEFIAEYKGLGNVGVYTISGEMVKTRKITEDKIAFDTTAGQTYVFMLGNEHDRLIRDIADANGILKKMNGSLLGTARVRLLAAIRAAEQSFWEGQDTQGRKDLAEARKTAEAALRLEVSIQEAEKLDLTKMEEAGAEVFRTVLSEAGRVLSDANAGSVKLEEAILRLKEAGNALKQKPAMQQKPAAVLTTPELKSVKSVLGPKGPRVKITVKAVPEGADSCRIYRKAGGKTTTVGTADKNGVVYDESPLLTGKAASYFVKAISGNISYADSANSPAKTLKLPKAPGNIRAAKSGKTVTISWSKVKQAKSYLVFRSDSKKSGYKKIASVKNKTSFKDTKTKNRKHYYAVVTVGSGKKYSGMRVLTKKK